MTRCSTGQWRAQGKAWHECSCSAGWNGASTACGHSNATMCVVCVASALCTCMQLLLPLQAKGPPDSRLPATRLTLDTENGPAHCWQQATSGAAVLSQTLSSPHQSVTILHAHASVLPVLQAGAVDRRPAAPGRLPGPVRSSGRPAARQQHVAADRLCRAGGVGQRVVGHLCADHLPAQLP
jgi:hypothetical protein